MRSRRKCILLLVSCARTFQCVVRYLIETSSSWRSVARNQPSSDWIQASFDDTTWTYIDGDAQSYNSGTIYVRKTFTGVQGMAAYELAYYLQYGIVIYVNGKEVFRDNMPE